VKTWALRLREAAKQMAGIPPEQAALLLSVGLVLGVFPMVGIPTVLCLIAAFVLRLNPAALQVLNSITSPLQLVLLLPLARVGSHLLGAGAGGGSLVGGSLVGKLSVAVLHAIAGWALVCIPLGFLLYLSLLLVMRRARSLRMA
jgi:hypothetical protein